MNKARIAAWWDFPRRHPVWTGAAGLIVLLTLVLMFVDWNWARRPVQRIVSGATEREFRIDGDLDIDFLPLEVRAEKVYLGNAPWSAEPAMARIEAVNLRVRFWPLLAGRFTLPRIALEQPWLRLERNEDGIGNWVFGESCGPEGCPQRLRILQLHARDGQLEVREPALQTALDIDFESSTPTSRDALAPLVLHGRGTYRGAPFGIAGHVDSPLELQGKPQPYQLDLTLQAGETQARVSGTLEEPLQTQDVAVNFELKGADLAQLYELVGIALPRTPPYTLKGLLSRHGNRYAYEGFTGTVGDSDLSGTASVDTGGPRLKLTASLKSKLIDFDDLSGFIGGTPGAGKGETASALQKKAARAQRASGKLLPAKPIEFSKLRSMDADVELIATKVESPKLPLETMSAHLMLEDGLLTLTPLNFGAAGGTLAGSVRVDARRIPADFTLAMQFRQLHLPKLMPKAKLLRDSTGNINGVVNLDGHGNSAASILATADGEIGFIMGAGRMSNLLLEIAGLDVAETLGFLIGKDKQVRLRCAYADFNVSDGIATARSVAIDTTDTALLIRGDINFRNESLDLTLLPRPKDMSPISIRTPIKIAGTFADPSFAPKGGPLLLRGAAVAALAAIAPPLALVGLIETGPGDDTNCGRAPPQAEEKKDNEKKSRPAAAPKPAHKT
jgi:AsmA family protein